RQLRYNRLIRITISIWARVILDLAVHQCPLAVSLIAAPAGIPGGSGCIPEVRFNVGGWLSAAHSADARPGARGSKGPGPGTGVAGLVGSGTSARRRFHGQAGYGAQPGDRADSRVRGGAGTGPGTRVRPGLAGVERQDPAGPPLRRVAVAIPRGGRADLGGGQQPAVGAVRVGVRG